MTHLSDDETVAKMGHPAKTKHKKSTKNKSAKQKAGPPSAAKDDN
jgi:hypothetical protein